MRRQRKTTNERLEDELDDLDGEGISLPPRMQVGWRRSDGLRRMPRERDLSDLRYTKTHRVHGHAG
jgi:hypothetical protein